MPKVVIIGGSYGGCFALQEIRGISKSLDIEVISASDEIWFNCAAPRLLIEPDKIKDSLFPLEKFVNYYNATFTHAKVTTVDLHSNTITLEGKDDSVSYDYLIIATGTTAGDAFKVNASAQGAIDALKKEIDEINKASSIAIIGGNPTAVEVAGELAHEFKNKHITMTFRGATPMKRMNLPEAVQKLKDVGVEIVPQSKAESIVPVENGFKVTFDNGKDMSFDHVIDTTYNVPCSEFLPDLVKNERGYVITDEYLVMKGTTNVIVVGDLVETSPQSIIDMRLAQMPVLGATAKRIILKNSSKMKKYKPADHSIFVPVSRKGGVGKLFGWKVPNFVVWYLKARTFLLEVAKKEFQV